MKKICNNCLEEKDIIEFARDKNNKDGLQRRCRKCQKEFSKDHYLRNKKRYRKSNLMCKSKNMERTWSRSSLGHHKNSGCNIRISIDDLEKLARETKICKYCGCELVYSVSKKYGSVTQETPTLDRINNETELTLDNIQIICHECNRTKGARTHDEFMRYCKFVSNKYK